MNILWFTWKDLSHPMAGGAEVFNEELARQLVRHGYRVILIVGGYGNAPHKETIDGYTVIRLGSRWSVYWKAYRYYKKYLQGWPHLVIDEVNTFPFFAKFYVKEKNILFVHQLCREIWFSQMFFPLNMIGYLLEPLYLFLLRDRKVMTVSESSKTDLMRYGFKEKRITIISEGIQLEPVQDLKSVEKFSSPTILAFGSVRKMKRTDHGLKAFAIAKQGIPDLHLIVAGAADTSYGKKVLKEIKASAFQDSITFLGKVSQEKKIELMARSHLILATSLKEGWGLVVTEANSQGTPAVAYNVDGLRDNVQHGITGLVSERNTPVELASNIVALLQNSKKYNLLRKNAWEWSKGKTFEKSYQDFVHALHKL
jgi:glycosyltransferase involved in cell wall biosynthesis